MMEVSPIPTTPADGTKTKLREKKLEIDISSSPIISSSKHSKKVSGMILNEHLPSLSLT
jgi:hypothetical protein